MAPPCAHLFAKTSTCSCSQLSFIAIFRSFFAREKENSSKDNVGAPLENRKKEAPSEGEENTPSPPLPEGVSLQMTFLLVKMRVVGTTDCCNKLKEKKNPIELAAVPNRSWHSFFFLEPDLELRLLL
jgi:hypothetical protein